MYVQVGNTYLVEIDDCVSLPTKYSNVFEPSLTLIYVSEIQTLSLLYRYRRFLVLKPEFNKSPSSRLIKRHVSLLVSIPLL